MNTKPKRSVLTRINDQVCPTPINLSDIRAAVGEKLPKPNTSVRVSYVPDVPTRVEPAKLPRLFIQGGHGGSIKMDLSGVGVWLNQSAFAFTMPDESLGGLDVHSGDIAIIEPTGNSLEIGNLVLVYDGARETLRQITSLPGGVRVQAADGKNAESSSFLTFSLLGVVVGILRLFRDVVPVNYQPEEFRYDPPPEVSETTIKFRTQHPAVAKQRPPQVYYPSNLTQTMNATIA